MTSWSIKKPEIKPRPNNRFSTYSHSKTGSSNHTKKKCPYGIKCKYVRTGNCKLYHQPCRNGFNCKLRMKKQCGFFHPKNIFVDQQNQNNAPTTISNQKTMHYNKLHAKSQNRPFTHPNPHLAQTKTAKKRSTSDLACAFIIKGCTGNLCQYGHPKSAKDRGNYYCQFGDGCKFGDKCQYKHVSITGEWEKGHAPKEYACQFHASKKGCSCSADECWMYHSPKIQHEKLENKNNDAKINELKRQVKEEKLKQEQLKRENKQQQEEYEEQKLEQEQKLKQQQQEYEEKQQQLKQLINVVNIWQWKDDNGNFNDYDKETSDAIDTLSENKSVQIRYESGGSHTSNVIKQSPTTAKQINVSTKTERAVQMIQKSIPRTVGQVTYPIWWDKKSQYAKPVLIELDLNATPGMDVVADFLKTCPNKTVVKVVSIQYQMLYDGYWNARERLIKSLGKDNLNEIIVYHGTKQIDTMKEVYTQGFRNEFSSNAAFGEGTYFATNASYSANGYSAFDSKTGTNQMFQCKVIMGQSVIGSSSYKLKLWPKKSNGLIYDSLVDNMANPSVIVIHANERAYPMFIIHFK